MYRLHDRLPDRITINGRTYLADFDFRNVLRMLDILTDGALTVDARNYLALKCLMKRPPRDTAAGVEAVSKILFPKQKEQDVHEKITDFDQDADLIRAAFRQAYGINLYEERLHWMEFMGLLQGLPDGCRYCNVIQIRARPVPAANQYNEEERNRLIEAKNHYALELSEAERRQSLEHDMRTFAAQMLALAETGGDRKNG